MLLEEIVNPLRKNHFVRADRVLKLRQLLDRLSSVTGLMSEEKDPEEFLNSLLAQILRADPFLKVGVRIHLASVKLNESYCLAAEFRFGYILLSAVCGEGRTLESALGSAAVRAELPRIEHQVEGGAFLFDYPDATIWQELQNVSAHPSVPGARCNGYH